ncbi:CPBP family intramembrane glutamic endopeptidase [Cellulomonas sp.]|uniref:CPBP family intramembrane glutamic endopeptidase n=1 Tax=Cellulomonas sp. TaxID=40001 RepID=UPI001B29C725|nr:CPBP family intramembrane glutamic endopeptidase [Cellulomonas sp.]MBO9556364.1 CPBP family intramembrane metalloprotease [Cellulomonas sp.]
MSTPAETSRWTAFWDRGGWWRAVLLAAVYLALYLGASLLVGSLFGDQVDADDVFATPQSVFFGLTMPLVVGCAVLVAFVASVRWFPVLFGRQPVPGRRWMWLAPALVGIAVVLRLLGIDYGAYAGGVVFLTLLTGAFIGFAEEVLTRGIVVKMLRDAGRSERGVMVLSSLVFALLHASNLLGGQKVVTVALTIAYTFCFGICMYLTLRVTGNLVWPIVLHGLYDPTLFLSTGGIDTTTGASENTFLVLAGPANILFIVLAVVALFAVRGRARPTGPAEAPAVTGEV